MFLQGRVPGGDVGEMFGAYSYTILCNNAYMGKCQVCRTGGFHDKFNSKKNKGRYDGLTIRFLCNNRLTCCVKLVLQ